MTALYKVNKKSFKKFAVHLLNCIGILYKGVLTCLLNKSRNIQVLLHFVFSAIFYRHFMIHNSVSTSLVKVDISNYNL